MIVPPPDHLLYRWPRMYRELVERIIWAMSRADRNALATSWFRDQATNASVGGHPFSQHRLGFAVDLVSQREGQLGAALLDAGLHVVPESDHIHIQAFPAGYIPQHLFTV